MANDLTPIETIMEPLRPRFQDVLEGTGLPVERLMSTFYFACEQNPRLLKPEFRASLPAACLTFAALGVEMDGATGQGFIIPFGGKNPKAQPLIGYKGYPTIAARSGVSIDAGVIREGDECEFRRGSDAKLEIRPQLGKEHGRKIIASYAIAKHATRPPVIEVLSIDEVLAVRNKFAGSKADSPWKDEMFGFPAMAAKTAVRRLGKMLPIRGIQIAARMDEAFEEQGLTSHVTADQDLVIEGEVVDVAANVAEATKGLARDPTEFHVILADGSRQSFPTIARWRAFMLEGIEKTSSDRARLCAFWDRNREEIDRVKGSYPGDVDFLESAFQERAG